MINLRLPNITAQNEKGQLEQIRSYLYQFAEQLNWALNNIDKQATDAVQKVEATTQKKDAVEQAHATFSEVKSLIIKSADIVDSYYKEISHRLDGMYVAQSDFGTYMQETSLTIDETPTSITAMFENLQAITSNVASVNTSIGNVAFDVAGIGESVTKLGNDIGTYSGDVKDLEDSINAVDGKYESLQSRADGVDENLQSINGVLERGEGYTRVVSTQAWCKIGLLSEGDETPIYGMEIGQVDSTGGASDKKIAQYRSDGVYLYDQHGKTPVATISNNTIDITNAKIDNAEVTDTLTIGGYKVTTSNGLTFKWQGRG